MTNVLIGASSPAMRAGLRALLADTSVQIVGEVPTLDGLSAEDVPFDALLVADEGLLLDVEPELFEAGTLAIVLMADDEQALELLQGLPLHGWGIVPLDATAGELHAALLAAAQGLVTLSLPMAEQLINSPLKIEADELIESLTPRESQVLALLAQGLPNKLIARELRISTHTVKFHISSIFTKLGATSRTDAVSRGARYGLIML
ncbi:MAG: response regulator transcription factor [Ardenticatenaceae bacterium]